VSFKNIDDNVSMSERSSNVSISERYNSAFK